MNGFTEADMATAAANGHAEGYQAGYADAVKAFEAGKSAAAQEAAVLYYVTNIEKGGDFNYIPISMFDQPAIFSTDAKAQAFCDFANGAGSKHEVRTFAAPVAAAPVDRAALLYLMQQFDAESWQCPQCGHAEDTATMDSAHYLRRYLAENPVASTPAAPVEVERAQVNMDAGWYARREQHAHAMGYAGVGEALEALERMRTPAAPVVDTRLARWIIAAVGDIPYSTMTSGQVIDALRTTRHVYEGNEGCGTYYKGDNTPAAPGIDLEQFREAVTVAVMFDKRATGLKPDYARLLALIDVAATGIDLTRCIRLHLDRAASINGDMQAGLLLAELDGAPCATLEELQDRMPDASPKGGSDARYFSADPAMGEFTTHATLQAAIDGATSMLSDAADEAHEGGWSDEPPQICYGVVLGKCVEIEGSRKAAPEGSDFAEHVDFKLQATSAEVGE